jgi:prolyl-tRNA editing enzyme YbaK/EbsC (Cys-tRNA(Pro) deacylase)
VTVCATRSIHAVAGSESGLYVSSFSTTGEQRLLAYLAEHGIAAEIVRPGVPMPTVPLAAAAIGVTEAQIIKSVLFHDPSGEVVLAIASGTGRIDRKLLASAAAVGKLRLADAATVLDATGFPAGGVSPIGHARPITVVIDTRVMALDEVYGGAGSEETLLRISPREIALLTNAIVAGIVETQG